MTFKTFLAEAFILEGGAAIKGSQPLTQAEAREISMHVIRDLKRLLKLESKQIATVGSAGLKGPDELSGDIDIAVMADVTLVKTAVESMALDGRFRHMPGLNVYSFAKLHGSKVAQVDIIPTTSITLAKWAYHNDPADLKLGLKGSHRNELLFAIAKHAEYVSKGKDATGADSARERLVFDLSRGLYRFVQDRAGKKGLTKSFATRDKVLLTSDPDKICARLFGDGVTAKQVMTFGDALKLVLSPSFKHKRVLPQILARAVEGLERKKLVVPHELRATVVKEAIDKHRHLALELQAKVIDQLDADGTLTEIEPGALQIALTNNFFLCVLNPQKVKQHKHMVRKLVASMTSETIISLEHAGPLNDSEGQWSFYNVDNQPKDRQVLASFNSADMALEWLETWYERKLKSQAGQA